MRAADRTVEELFADFFVESIALDPERNMQLGAQFGIKPQDNRLRECSDGASDGVENISVMLEEGCSRSCLSDIIVKRMKCLGGNLDE